MRSIAVIVGLVTLFVGACNQKSTCPVIENEVVKSITNTMTDVMVHDVTNPPLATRFYSYALLSGYEVIALYDSNYATMHGKIRDFPKIVRPESKGDFSVDVAAILAITHSAQKLQPSGAMIIDFEKRLIDSLQNIGYTKKSITLAKEFGAQVAGQLLKFAKEDNYRKISNYPRYEPLKGEGYWYPTPPGYFPPVEPYFNTIRPFTLDSASQFKPVPPIAFSTKKTSGFYKLMQENYSLEVVGEKAEIAAFWDCNPFALENKGHLMVGMKKISPGAHWIGITAIACEKAGKNFRETLLINTSVAMGMMDGFITCWDEKYRSNRIRPETAIRKYIDPTWTPFLQTPPFPEYLSGHSVISSAAAEILTHYFGDDFQYTDTVEERFGLKARTFSSFRAAALESGLSRFYGGIHFMDAIDNGRKEGVKVGEWVVKKLSE